MNITFTIINSTCGVSLYVVKQDVCAANRCVKVVLDNPLEVFPNTTGLTTWVCPCGTPKNYPTKYMYIIGSKILMLYSDKSSGHTCGQGDAFTVRYPQRRVHSSAKGQLVWNYQKLTFVGCLSLHIKGKVAMVRGCRSCRR